MKLLAISPVVFASALYLVAPVATHAQTFLFDFGSTNQTTGQPQAWNNVLNSIGTNPNGVLLDLVSSDGSVTGVDLRMVTRFSGENQNGALTTSTDFPSSATRDSLYGNTENFNGQANNFPSFKLTDLDPAKTYDFTFYASRMPADDNRETLYTVSGGISGSVALNAANNINETVSLFGITPNATGEILISLSPGANNNNSNHFTYLGVMVVTAVPEPSAAMCLAGGAALLFARRRRTV